MSLTEKIIMCPVCGGKVFVSHEDSVNLCQYCASPVLGPSQNRNCVNHPDRLATEVCHVCGDLICDECAEKRVGDYGGKLLTLVNCTKPECVSSSSWANLLNAEYQKLTNMDWSDKADNFILRITGIGAVLMMIFELIFVLGMLFMYLIPSIAILFPVWTIGGFVIPFLPVIIPMILGNFLAALLLQTALQVYVHDRQLGSGIVLLFVLIIESAFLILRGLYFNLLQLPDSTFLLILLSAFSVGVILVFIGSLGAIYVGNKKRIQMKRAQDELGLSIKRGMEELAQ